MADSTAMTIEFLRARLLSERSVSRSARQRADQLAKRVLELEEQLRVVISQRKQAEKATNEVLSILESRGFSDFTEAIDSYSDRDNVLEEGKCSNENSGEILNDDEASTASRIDETLEESESRGRSLSWISRTNSSESLDKKKEEQSRQRPKTNLLSRIGSSAQLPPGKSCRKIKKTLDRGIEKDDAGIDNPQTKGVDDATLLQPSDDQGDNQENISVRDDAMETAIEHQDLLIDRYVEEENAQREWEQSYKDPYELEKMTDATEYNDAKAEDGETRSECPPQTESFLASNVTDSPPPQFTHERRDGEEEKKNDQKEKEKTALCNEEPLDGMPPPDHGEEMMTDRPEGSNHEGHQEEIESVESRSEGGRVSKEQWSLIRNPIKGSDHADNPREADGREAENVLGALQRARLMLRQELNRIDPRRDELPPVCIPFGPSALFRLPSDVHSKAESPHLSLNSHGGFGDGIAISTFTETRTSIAATINRNLGTTAISGGFSSSFSGGESGGSRLGRRFAR